MKIELIALGRLKTGPERALAQRYAERFSTLGRGLALDGPHIIELPESQARRDGERKAEEGQAIAAALRAGYRLVLFDEGGTCLDSPGFARKLGQWRDDGAPGVSLVIGGADGLDPALKDKAQLILAFGAMTLPHQLVRVLVLEQIYRAATILAGHPYHRV